ncbi:protein eva-1 homolog A [Ochotona curzoniae]|uniref:protein eva-1 homolog A n=1 Tax=Ochotona curzoniae TaxID=130825 RepID=UPI001B3473C5|nr:protein eva-1 homolog A [Ochotona curzoniae]XP_040849571.1 protein eva-1 homolog A [Ochotona curzoniae]
MKLPFTPSMEPATSEHMEMALLSNILATYSFVSENPERAALYFVSGVCIGLVLTLAALVMRISCHTDCRPRRQRKFLQDRESSCDSSDSEDGSEDTASDLSVRRHRRFERTLNKNVFTSAEELERAQRLEERERIIREIWMNGQPEAPGARSLNRYY